MAWIKSPICTECGSEVPEFAGGNLPANPCQDGGGACCIVDAIVWDDGTPPALAPTQPHPFGEGAGGLGQGQAGHFAGLPLRGAVRRP